jgi:fluoride exporter
MEIQLSRCFCVLIGGGMGALARYLVALLVGSRYGGRFPLGTFLINVTGSFLIGLLMTFFTRNTALHPNWRLLLVTGFLGGYTTFSSFEYETYVAVQAGTPALGLLYVLSSVVAGYLATYAGALLLSRR